MRQTYADEDFKTSLQYIEFGLERVRRKESKKEEGNLSIPEAYSCLNRGLPQKALAKFSEVLKNHIVLINNTSIYGIYV